MSLRTPLIIAAMDTFLGLPTNLLETTQDIISSLLPVLKMDGEMKNEAQLLHKSVFDFLTTWATGDIYIDTALHNHMLAFNCLTYMNSVLKYDMKWILPSQLPSLLAAANIKTGDVTAITYACGHFIAHLASLMKDDPNPIDEPYLRTRHFPDKASPTLVQSHGLIEQHVRCRTSVKAHCRVLEGELSSTYE